MPLDLATIKTLFPRASDELTTAFADQNAAVFGQYAITDGNRLDFFLAQIGLESSGLSVLEENLSYRADRLCAVWPNRFPTPDAAAACAANPEALANTVYANRMGNGDAASGDGYQFRGRGYIMLTGRDAYARVGAIAGLDLIAEPDLTCDPQHALTVACAFWQWKNANPVCDSGDFTAVNVAVNGGTIGLADRQAWLAKVRRVLASPPDTQSQPSPAQVAAVQRALLAAHYPEVGAADWLLGPHTIAAIKRFRDDHQLGDGLIDDTLMAALGNPALERHQPA
jgi:putative chitinase